MTRILGSQGGASLSGAGAKKARLAACSSCLLALLGIAGGPARPTMGPPSVRQIWATHRSSEIAWLASYPDYAPQGVPDFSQCRASWSQPGSPGQWTHAGPVALANALWWLDSAAEPWPMHPSQPNDHHPLVTAYPQFGPLIDDHDAENVGPLVADLAWRANTDGQRAPQPERGTRWEALTAATLQYLAQRHLTAEYQVEELTNPAAAWLREQVRRGAGIVLLLGVWELQETQWRRVGGHYVTLAGLSLDGEPVLGVADPLADMAAGGNRGRVEPMDPSFHSCRLASRAHDDAAVVSLDTWTLVPSDLPLAQPMLLGYFTPSTYGEAAAFRGQNAGAAFAAYAGDWQRGPVVMALDAGMAIIPRGALPATASPPAHSPPAPIPTTSPTPRASTLTPTQPSGTPTSWPATSPSANSSWRHIWLPLGLRRR